MFKKRQDLRVPKYKSITFGCQISTTPLLHTNANLLLATNADLLRLLDFKTGWQVYVPNSSDFKCTKYSLNVNKEEMLENLKFSNVTILPINKWSLAIADWEHMEESFLWNKITPLKPWEYLFKISNISWEERQLLITNSYANWI